MKRSFTLGAIRMLPPGVRRLARRLRQHVRAFHRLGPSGAFAFALKEPWYRALAILIRRRPRTFMYRLAADGMTLYARAGSTDRQVFEQVFIDRQYDCLSEHDCPSFIVDCGANVGYAAAFFLSRFSRARLIAVEPDAENVDVLRLNTSAFGERVVIIPAAVWSHNAGLVVVRDPPRGEWEYSVRECQDGQAPEVESIDIASLLNLSPAGSIDVLKMDIEGAETVVMGSRPTDWVDAVGIFMIELHDDAARRAFFEAIGARPFTTVQRGELTVARRDAHRTPRVVR